MPRNIRDNEYSIKHSIERFQERYNTVLTPKQYEELCTIVKKMVQNNQNVAGTEITSRKPLIQQWILRFTWNDMEIIPVFESKRDCITTFLPLR